MPKPIDVVKREIRERLKGKNSSERCKELRKLLDEIPWSVGDYKNIRADLTRQLESSISSMSGTKRGGSASGFSFRKESPQMLILGTPNSGKSTFLNKYTRAGAKVADYPFTTTQPVIGTMSYNDVRIYMVEMPPLFEGCFEYDKRSFSLIRTTDGLLMTINYPEEYLVLQYELEKAAIGLKDNKTMEGDESRVKIYKPALIVHRREKPPTNLRSIEYSNEAEIKQAVYETLGIKRVYLLDNKNKTVLPPVVFIEDEFTVSDLLKRTGTYKFFKTAKIWGKTAKYDGEPVGLDYKLSDGAMIRIY